MKLKYNPIDIYIESLDIADARKTRIFLKKLYFYTKILCLFIMMSVSIYFYFFDKNHIISNKLYLYTKKFSIKTNMILHNTYISGINHIKREDILSALSIPKNEALLNIDLKDAYDNITSLDWVKSVDIYRQFPNSVHINIVEKKPIAIWQNSQKLYLIDEDGHLIRENNLKPFSKMIIVIGDDAPLHTNSLIKILQKDESLFKKVTSAIRISERRWNIRLNGDIEIKLPEENLENAWNYVIKLYKSDALFNKNISTLDLRIDKKLYLNYKNNKESKKTS